MTGDKENAIQCYNTFSNSLEKEVNLLLNFFIDPEEATKWRFKIRELNYKLMQRCKKVSQDNFCKNKKEEFDQNVNEKKRKIIKQIREENLDNARE